MWFSSPDTVEISQSPKNHVIRHSHTQISHLHHNSFPFSSSSSFPFSSFPFSTFSFSPSTFSSSSSFSSPWSSSLNFLPLCVASSLPLIFTLLFPTLHHHPLLAPTTTTTTTPLPSSTQPLLRFLPTSNHCRTEHGKAGHERAGQSRVREGKAEERPVGQEGGQ